MVRKVFAYRVEFHDGVESCARHHRAQDRGHSKGLQCVRVKTNAALWDRVGLRYLYSHLDEGRVFLITYSVGDT